MENCLAQVCLIEVRLSQPGSAEICLLEIRTCHGNVVEPGFAKIGLMSNGANQLAGRHRAAAEVGATQIRIREIRTKQVGVTEIRIPQIGSKEHRVAEVRSVEIRFPQSGNSNALPDTAVPSLDSFFPPSEYLGGLLRVHGREDMDSWSTSQGDIADPDELPKVGSVVASRRVGSEYTIDLELG